MRCILFTYSLLFLVVLTSCHNERNQSDHTRLVRLDSLMNISPEDALDSLNLLDSRSLSDYNRGYHSLLYVITRDKTYYKFTSDSLINTAVPVLAKFASRHSATYARSLMYQGLVRYRMGVTDSTAYQPIREAAKLFERLSPPDLKNSYLSNYYLGNIHEKNKNIPLAESYFSKALVWAKQLNDTSYLFMGYRNLFWSRMQLSDYPQARLYLDTLSQFPVNDVYDLIEIENMRTVYFQKTSNYSKALEAEKNLIDLKRANDQTISLSDLYNLSIIYKKLGMQDSAYRYGKMAVQAMPGHSIRLNYLYYKNLADITARMKKWEESASIKEPEYRVRIYFGFDFPAPCCICSICLSAKSKETTGRTA